MIFQTIIDIAEICARKEVTNVMLSPGSRCAPLTLAFARHPGIKTRIIPDERSSGFIGLGIAQSLKQPVALVCTSGTAAYNFAPAVAEAYFQHIPLIIFTADRPPELIDQRDGQTIRQKNIYGDHVKKSYDLPASYEHKDVKWHITRVISEAINCSSSAPAGPVQINLPFREPFYPDPEEEFNYSENIKVIDYDEPSLKLSDDIKGKINSKWTGSDKKLILGGQSLKNPSIEKLIDQVIKDQKVPVIGDIISNIHGVENVISHADIFLGQNNNDLKSSLKPDLLITVGRSIISKNLKLFLRAFKPKEHWHIEDIDIAPDTYQSLTWHIRINPENLLNVITGEEQKQSFEKQKQENYYNLWHAEEKKAKRFIDNFEGKYFSELEATKVIMQNLPEKCSLHLANSMPVRLANFYGLSAKHNDIEVFANRGTCGIDGSNSTAAGDSFTKDEIVLLLTGDMAFFYDRNAFWHNYPMANLRIIVLNNNAGGIFGLIDGPADLPELEEFFETKQELSAAFLAKEFGFEYSFAGDTKTLNNLLPSFFKLDGRTKIIEVETSKKFNKIVFNEFKEAIQKL